MCDKCNEPSVVKKNLSKTKGNRNQGNRILRLGNWVNCWVYPSLLDTIR